MSGRRIFLAIGSNLGDRRAYLQLAVDSLPDVARCSRIYETEPVGGPDDQGPYLNAVVELITSLSAREVFARAQMAEQAAGRVRVVANGPRTLDVDLLWIDGETIDDDDLTVPHPRMWERRFVLAPLSDLAPELLPPDWETKVVGEVWPVD